MACNSCAKGFSLLRQEKGCPGCGFSFCSKCLNNKVFLPKLNSEAKVCSKCHKSPEKNSNKLNQIVPPDAYYKRLAATPATSVTNPASIDNEIQARLKKLKEADTQATNEDVTNRLQAIKGGTSDTDIQHRLAKLKGSPIIVNKAVLPVKDLRTEQEQANDLIKQYVEQTQIDTKYKDEFDSLISDIETRMQKLKDTDGPGGAGTSGISSKAPSQVVDQEDEEESVRKIVEKLKAEASMEDSEIGVTNDELPFCEICNEDATLRCLGCRYLFCKRCYREHEDDDDGCNRYEPYKPPK